MSGLVTRVTIKPAKNRYEVLLKPLFDQALSGDRQAVSSLLHGVSELSRGYVCKKTGSHAEVEDVVQEILISVHKALHTYDPARPCMPWLAAIMHYRVTDWLRSRYHTSNAQKVPLSEVEDFLICGVTEDVLTTEYINKAIALLTDSQQAVIRSMYHQQLTVAETGEQLSMSVSAVKVTAHRAYKKLREQLEEEK